MRRAVALARRALGRTSPNPMVGCVLVKGGAVVGEGFHPKAGEPHAEVFALREAGEAAEGATAYVSLEPCDHFGRTPPCSQALVRARVARVVVGVVDPNALVGGKGIQTLRDAGIDVVVGVEEELCRANVEAFMHRMRFHKPMSYLRYSVAPAGQHAMAEAGSHHSMLLAAMDAVVIKDTAVRANPCLLSAEPNARQPCRIILADSTMEFDLESPIFDTATAGVVVVTDEGLAAEDAERCQKEGQRSTEARLLAKGADVVVAEEASIGLVLNVCYSRSACSILWESCGPPGPDNLLANLVLSEAAVQKVVAEAPAGVAEQVVEEISAGIKQHLERSTMTSHRDKLVFEGYVPGW
eukprot:SM000028S10199  [mRNA]  locus=s28:916038:917522:+ [translate_table: standard]